MSIFSVPLKTLLAWHADIQNDTPPLDYAICDGRTLTSGQQDINPGSTYTVPDLRHCFLIGADITKTAGAAAATPNSGNIEAAAGAPGPKGTGGENDHQISSSELASHGHGVTDPGHGHGVTDPGHSHSYNSPDAPVGASAGGAGSVVQNRSGQNTGGQSTGVSVQSGSTGISVGSTGADSSHENRPKFYGVVWIMKVKI